MLTENLKTLNNQIAWNTGLNNQVVLHLMKQAMNNSWYRTKTSCFVYTIVHCLNLAITNNMYLINIHTGNQFTPIRHFHFYTIRTFIIETSVHFRWHACAGLLRLLLCLFYSLSYDCLVHFIETKYRSYFVHIDPYYYKNKADTVDIKPNVYGLSSTYKFDVLLARLVLL